MSALSRLFGADAVDGVADEVAPKSEADEALARACLPVFVNSFNQLSYLRDTLQWFRRWGFRNVTVLDQASSYPPLIDYYASPEFAACARLMPLGANVGPRAALTPYRLVRWGMPHVFTDPDLGLPDPPDPLFLTRLFQLSRRWRAHKIGLALDISEPEAFHDLTVDTPEMGRVSIVEWERQFWTQPLEPDVYQANIDTTFYLYNPAPGLSWRSVRRKLQRRPLKMRYVRVAGPGFVAQHRPWRRDDGMPPEEAAFYAAQARPWSNWVDLRDAGE